MIPGGGGLEGIDLGCVGEDGEFGRALELGHQDGWVGRRCGEMEVVTVTVGGTARFELEDGKRVVEGGTKPDAAAAEVRMERAGTGIKVAGSLGPAGDPTEPVDVAAVGGGDVVAEGGAAVVVPVELGGDAELVEVVDALEAAGGTARPSEGGEEETGENGEDGEGDKELNEREPGG
jgi:hypothetical protein